MGIGNGDPRAGGIYSKVKWVSEMETLAQEAFILIYTKPDTNTATHKPDVSVSSCLDLKELFVEMTIRDTPGEEEKSRPVRPAQQDQHLPPADMKTLGHSYQKRSSKESATQPTGDPYIDQSNSL